MNYGELKAQVAFFTENANALWVAQVPEFIRSAETELWLAIEAPQAEFEFTGSLLLNTFAIPLPETNEPLNIKSVLTLNAGTSEWEPLLIRDYEFLRQAYPDTATRGVPRFYAYDLAAPDNTPPDDIILRVAPTPTLTTSYAIRYYGYPPSITTMADNLSTWLSRKCPDGLLYGALKHGYIGMKGEEALLATYTQEFQRALVQLKVLAEGRAFSDQYHDGATSI